jgi:small GTP-binding protein
MCGDPSVGKSELVREFVSDVSPQKYEGPTRVHRAWKSIDIGGFIVEITIWDPPGHHSFFPIIPTHCSNVIGAILVYDVTNHESFESIPEWIELVKNAARPNAVLMLVGNKCDVTGPRPVTREEAEKFARANNVLFTEASAKSGLNVSGVFKKLATKILEQGVQ